MQDPPAYNQENSSSSSSTGPKLAHDADLLIRTYIPEPSSSFKQDSNTALVLCVPQAGLNPKEQSGFIRGYNPELGDIGISQSMFLNFIDGLNMAISASPPLRVVNTVGNIIGFVPYHWAMIAGIVLNFAAGIAIHIISKTITDRYLRAANANLFKPRGYSVRLCTTSAMLALCNVSESKVRSKMNKFGRGVGTVFLQLPLPIINPIASTIVHAIADKTPTIAASGREGDPINSPMLRRRLAMTREFALPLTVDDLPPPEKPQGVMDTMASWGVSFDNAVEKRSERNVERRRRAMERIKEAGIEAPPSRSMLLAKLRYSSSSLVSQSSQSSQSTPPSSPPSTSRSSSFKGVASQALNAYSEHRLRKEIKEEELELQRRAAPSKKSHLGIHNGLEALRRKKKTTMERKVADADLLEHWGSDKILWIVIMPSEKDAEISDIDIADDLANEERIDDNTWKTEMELERDELELDDIQELKEQEDLKQRRPYTSEQSG